MRLIVPSIASAVRAAVLSASLLLPTIVAAATFPVSTLSALRSALSSARSGDEIVVAPGTYTTSIELYMSYAGVTLRGSTGDRDDVVIKGGGFNNSNYARVVLHVNAANCTVKDLTLGDCYWHALFFENGANYAVIRNVRIYNAGEQVVKGVRYSTGGLIEQCLMEYTEPRINDGQSNRPDDYLGGIDLHGAINWTIRDNLIRNIIGQGGDGDSGIFLWNQSAGCIVERNIIYGCNKGISYGNPSNGNGVYHMDGGIVRNNFIYAMTSSNADIGMEMCFVKNIKVYNNTIWTDSGSFFRTVQFNDSTSIPNTNVQLANNIIRGRFNDFTRGRFTSTNDLTQNVPQANWFVNAGAANYHLTRLATAAIDQAIPNVDVAEDFDGQLRPSRSAGDIGADEYLWGDINGDNLCSVGDVQQLVAAWNTTSGDAGYNAMADLDGNNRINIGDLQILVADWGR